jgi:hypothetical protein
VNVNEHAKQLPQAVTDTPTRPARTGANGDGQGTGRGGSDGCRGGGGDVVVVVVVVMWW